MSSDPNAPDSPRTLAVLLFGRTSLNLQQRIIYPFLPVIARGLGVPFETATLLVTVRSFTSALSPFYGVAADRYGRRPLMLAGLLALTAGAVLTALAPGLGIALVAFALLGFSKAAYDPAMQAYVGDAVPYERRGRVMSLLELSWSASWFIGVPVAGFVIASSGWRAPFFLIAVAGGLAVLALWRLCPMCGRTATQAGRFSALEGFRKVPWRRALPFLLLTWLITLANENVFIVYGAWLEKAFGLAIAVVGVASLVISVAELTGELASAGIVDRLGKRRSVLIGLVCSVAAYLLLAPLAGSLAGGLFGIGLMFLTFEFSIVASIPLISEVAPEARGTMMALNVSAAALGRMAGSVSGPRLWSAGGLQPVALLSAGLVFAAAVLLLFLREHPVTVTSSETGV
jgi:MFS transporter, DHA1 family, inner membrane transport protein